MKIKEPSIDINLIKIGEKISDNSDITTCKGLYKGQPVIIKKIIDIDSRKDIHIRQIVEEEKVLM